MRRASAREALFVHYSPRSFGSLSHLSLLRLLPYTQTHRPSSLPLQLPLLLPPLRHLHVLCVGKERRSILKEALPSSSCGRAHTDTQTRTPTRGVQSFRDHLPPPPWGARGAVCQRGGSSSSMSSLVRCTDALLQQKAVQSSHHERLERHLRDGERCRRAAVLSLRQRIADVSRRGNDLLDLRRENRQLADQLAQHALQHTALQCRHKEACQGQAAALERLQDGVRGWSGHPARIVLIVQALQAQRLLRRAGRRFVKLLRTVHTTLRLRHRVREFASGAARLLRSHAALQATLSGTLQTRRAEEAAGYEAAVGRCAEAEKRHHDVVVVAQQAAERELLLRNAEACLLDVYAGAADEIGALATAAIAAVTDAIDSGEARLSSAQVELRAKTDTASAAKAALAAQCAAHAGSVAAWQDETARRRAEQDGAVADAAAAGARRTEREACVAEARAATPLLMRRAVAAALLSLLCERYEAALAAHAARRAEEAAAMRGELVVLRDRHAAELERCRSAKVAAARAAAVYNLLSSEQQSRRATTDLECDEWRLLYAQLVREACRARAAAATAAAAAAASVAASRARRATPAAAAVAVNAEVNAEETHTAHAAAGAARPPQRKRARGRSSHSTAVGGGGSGGGSSSANAAARRQRAALEAVDALTMNASQGGSSADPAAATPEQAAAVPRPCRASAAASAAAPHPTYRLTSVKPPSVTKPALPQSTQPTTAPEREGRQRRGGGGGTRVTVDAAALRRTPLGVPSAVVSRATALSPFTSAAAAAVSEDEGGGGEYSGESNFSVPQRAGSDDPLPTVSPSPLPRRPHVRRNAGWTAPVVQRPQPLQRPPTRHSPHDAEAGAAVGGSALASAVAACTPGATAPPPYTGSSVALPGRVGSGAGRNGGVRLLPKPLPPVSRRRPPMMATAAATCADVGEDLFADLFS